jgi:hypothetical protein
VTMSVEKDQWVSLWWGQAGNKKPLARGILLLTLSMGTMQKRGFIYATQSKQLEMHVGE